MIRRQKRRLPMESDSSEDDSSKKIKLQFSKVSNLKRGKNYNTRTRSNASVFVSDQSSTSEEEIVHSPRCGFMRALSDYDTCDSAEGSTAPQRPGVSGHETDSSSSDGTIQITSRNRKRNMRFHSSSSSDSSDSGVPLGFRRRKKRMKFLSTSSESSNEGVEESVVRLDIREGSQRRETRSRTRRGRGRIRITRRGNSDTCINVTFNDTWKMSVGNLDDENWSVRISEIPSSSDSESSDSDIRPQILSVNSRREFQSNTSSSSDSEDEIPARRPKKRRVVRNIIESDVDDGSKNEITPQSEKEDEECPICLNPFTSQTVGKPQNCDHKFCLPCINTWAKTINTCPVDRKLFDEINVYTATDAHLICKLPVFNVQGMLEWQDNQLEMEPDVNNDNSEDLDVQDSGELCCVCFSGSRANDMIYCDICFEIYHLHCIEPPMRNFPVGPWLCAYCENNLSD